jgi:hypothetical protein
MASEGEAALAFRPRWGSQDIDGAQGATWQPRPIAPLQAVTLRRTEPLVADRLVVARLQKFLISQIVKFALALQNK